ncbi:MAG: hypothetical protein P4L53_04015 [Candidatus Obscuribacterales bacterium]|nr:hypothetical protein [Candidatus Obscuribacterales bacterium]
MINNVTAERQEPGAGKARTTDFTTCRSKKVEKTIASLLSLPPNVMALEGISVTV